MWLVGQITSSKKSIQWLHHRISHKLSLFIDTKWIFTKNDNIFYFKNHVKFHIGECFKALQNISKFCLVLIRHYRAFASVPPRFQTVAKMWRWTAMVDPFICHGVVLTLPLGVRQWPMMCPLLFALVRHTHTHTDKYSPYRD
jgi:hypothetical protein